MLPNYSCMCGLPLEHGWLTRATQKLSSVTAPSFSLAIQVLIYCKLNSLNFLSNIFIFWNFMMYFEYIHPILNSSYNHSPLHPTLSTPLLESSLCSQLGSGLPQSLADLKTPLKSFTPKLSKTNNSLARYGFCAHLPLLG